MNVLKLFELKDITDLLSGNYIDVMSKYLLPIAIPLCIIALINCFFGYKVFQILVGLVGTLIGALLGGGIVSGLSFIASKQMPSIGVIAIGAAVGAIVIGFTSFKLYKGGAFCMGFITGMILGVLIMKLIGKDEYLIAGVIGGLLMGLLAIDLYRHLVILLTALNGGFVSVACLAIILKKDAPAFILTSGLVLTLLGIIVQYILLFVSKKNAQDEDDEEEDMEEELSRKQKKSKNKKENRKQTKHRKKEKTIKSRKNKNKNKKEPKKHSYDSEFFLVEIISNIAQPIKDFVVRKMDLEEDEYEEEYDEYEEEEYEEDEYEEEYDEYEEEEYDEDEYDEYEEDELEDESDDEFAKEEEKRIEEKRIEEKMTAKQFKEMQPSYSKPTTFVAPTIKFKEEEVLVKEDVKPSINNPEMEEVTIPVFDLEDISHKLEEELDHSLELEKDKELEELIIKEAYKNLR